MKITISVLTLYLLLFATCVQAVSVCSNNPEILGAKYQVTVKKDNEEETQYPVNLWRNESLVVYEYPLKQKAEYWYLPDNGKNKAKSLQMTRYYDGFKRGIEYQVRQKSITDTQRKWLKLNSVIALSEFELLPKRNVLLACDSTQKFEQQDSGLSLEWFNHYQLPKQFAITKGNTIKSWQLVELITDVKQVRRHINRRTDFVVTDYADVGDNEHDEFLSKMIVMGF